MPIQPYTTLPLVMKSSIAFLTLLIRYGEAQADAAPRRGGDPGVHPDHLAPDVDEGAARIALVDRGVGLDEVVDVAVRAARAIDGAHRSGRHRGYQPEGLPIAIAQSPTRTTGGVAETGHGDVRRVALELHERDIPALVLADQGGLVLLLVVGDDSDIGRRARDMVVRQHVDGLPVLPDDDARAKALFGVGLLVLARAVVGVVEEESPRELVLGIALGAWTFSMTLISTTEGWTLSAT